MDVVVLMAPWSLVVQHPPSGGPRHDHASSSWVGCGVLMAVHSDIPLARPVPQWLSVVERLAAPIFTFLGDGYDSSSDGCGLAYYDFHAFEC